MTRLAILLVLALAVLGCSKAEQGGPSVESRAVKRAQSVAQPQAINALYDQTLVYECPKCGMDYDKPGQCPMDNSELVATQVAYICPADNQPVEHTGKCPRCDANARVEKTALASGGSGGN